LHCIVDPFFVFSKCLWKSLNTIRHTYTLSLYHIKLILLSLFLKKNGAGEFIVNLYKREMKNGTEQEYFLFSV